MSRKIKHFVLSIPLLGYGLRIVTNIARLPTLNDSLSQQSDMLKQLNVDLESKSQAIYGAIDENTGRVKAIQTTHEKLQQQIMLIDRQVGSNTNQAEPTKKRGKVLFADDHLLDAFYANFEDRFRGSEDTIQTRLEEYLPYFKSSKFDFKKYPVLDIGCGRGELLQLLNKNNIRSIGLDINIDMVERAKNKGLEAIEGDALEFIQNSKPQSFGAITGFHLVEHIPFNILLRLFTAIHRSLTDEGFVIFETPNPENLTVSGLTFYLDPSHLHPLPPDLLAFTLETCGFRKIEIKRLHPDDTYKGSRLPTDVMQKLYGPRDYAVIAYK